jgi:uncharacterized protein (DUF1015 family)
VTEIAPFRALRYDESVAGPLADLVAPPYDVIDDDDLYTLWHTNERNIVHLTRPDSPELAASELATWRDEGVLREEEPALWWLSQEFAGPDGVERVRDGIFGSIEVTPYSEGKVLRHEETHSKAKEDRLNLLRATRTQLEPIFLIYDAEAPFEAPGREPDFSVTSGGSRSSLWRLDSGAVDIDVPFLIADGHHRYETAVNYREEEPSATHTLAVLVSSRSPGLQLYPTHRVAQAVETSPFGFMTSTWDTDSLAMYRTGNFFRLESEDELDTREIEQYGLEDVEYTADAQQAVEAVDSDLAQIAFLVRAPSIEQVFAYANRGETMPPKSTFFYPKLTSGLFLLPVQP